MAARTAFSVSIWANRSADSFVRANLIRSQERADMAALWSLDSFELGECGVDLPFFVGSFVGNFVDMKAVAEV